MRTMLDSLGTLVEKEKRKRGWGTPSFISKSLPVEF
jgi:hypothetical protein